MTAPPSPAISAAPKHFDFDDATDTTVDVPLEASEPTAVVGDYRLYKEIAAGGMGTIHLARKMGDCGFSRPVAIKKIHPHYADDPDFVSALLDEACMAACVRHANVVATLDLVKGREAEDVLLVMEYVHGASLAQLVRLSAARGVGVPLPIAVAILCGVLRGLHAAHTARAPTGVPLNLVHRDVSPQNVLVGADGIARVVDFGIAKAVGRLSETRDGRIKGKYAYIAPEQRRGEDATRAADIYSASVVLWELCMGRRLFEATSDADLLLFGLTMAVPAPPACEGPGIPKELDALVRRGLAANPEDRFPTALAMTTALEKTVREATATEVGAWVSKLAKTNLSRLTARLLAMDTSRDAPSATHAASEGEVVITHVKRRTVPPKPSRQVAVRKPTPFPAMAPSVSLVPPAPGKGAPSLLFEEEVEAKAMFRPARWPYVAGVLGFAALAISTAVAVLPYGRTNTAPPIVVTAGPKAAAALLPRDAPSPSTSASAAPKKP